MRARVLIADDEAAILTSLEFLFRQAGYETGAARDGDEALRLAKSFRPDLAVIDFMLPKLSGVDVCRAIRADTTLAPMKLLMLSARGGVRDLAAGEAVGVDAYYVKPFSTKDLMREVARLLAQPGHQHAS